MREQCIIGSDNERPESIIGSANGIQCIIGSANGITVYNWIGQWETIYNWIGQWETIVKLDRTMGYSV